MVCVWVGRLVRGFRERDEERGLERCTCGGGAG